MAREMEARGTLQVEPAEDPIPRLSFGDIGRFVRVTRGSGWEGGSAEVVEALLKVTYSDEDVGWVDENTLRLFAIDPQGWEAGLIEDSAADVPSRCVTAQISGAGLYGIYGLPADPQVLATVRTFLNFRDALTREADRGSRELGDRICQLVLCSPNFDRDEEHRMPGRFEGTVCDFCLGLEHYWKLPEFQILHEIRAKPCRKTKPKPKPCVPTVTVTPNCGPAYPEGAAIYMDVSCFPANTFCSFELLDSNGDRIFLGGGTTDAFGSGNPGGGLEGWWGLYQPQGNYTFHVFVDTDGDGIIDQGGVEASVSLIVPC